MTDRLEAWLEGRHAGHFDFPDDGPPTFTYSDSAPATPISLSLPRGGRSTVKAASNFLENLLPDHDVTRERMATAYGAASPRTFDLLVTAGGDIAGGLVLTPEGQDVPSTSMAIYPALDQDIATRIAAIKRDSDDWIPEGAEARFSLAGTQGKFALAEIDGEWYWSNAGVPSTHIAKPARTDLRHLESAESSALTLARTVGVPAAPAEVATFIDQTTFLTERFDRVCVGDEVRRLHAEDLAQALGTGPKEKYEVDLGSVARLLRSADTTGQLLRDFLRQLVFNVVIGNADAHAKNYSVMLRPDSVTLSPLYDAVPVMLYPRFNQKLAMKVSGAEHAQAIQRPLWVKQARAIGFDPDEMVDIVSDVAGKVGEHNDGAWTGLDDAQARTLRDGIGRNVDVALARTPRTVEKTRPTGGQRRRPAGDTSGGQYAPQDHTPPEVTLGG